MATGGSSGGQRPRTREQGGTWGGGGLWIWIWVPILGLTGCLGEHNGVPNDSTDQLAMPYDTHISGPQRASPMVPLGVTGPRWRWATPRSTRGVPTVHTAAASTALDGLTLPIPWAGPQGRWAAPCPVHGAPPETTMALPWPPNLARHGALALTQARPGPRLCRALPERPSGVASPSRASLFPGLLLGARLTLPISPVPSGGPSPLTLAGRPVPLHAPAPWSPVSCTAIAHFLGGMCTKAVFFMPHLVFFCE